MLKICIQTTELPLLYSSFDADEENPELCSGHMSRQTPVFELASSLYKRRSRSVKAYTMRCVGWQLKEEDMAETKTERGAESPMKSRGLSRCPRIMVEKSLRAAEAVEQARDDDNGVVRVKIVVTKRQLRQMVASMGQGPCDAAGPQAATASASASNLELLLHVLRRRHMKRSETGRGKRHGGGRWRPALKSIPEDIIQD